MRLTDRHIFMVGPCSAESREQVLSIAQEVSNIAADDQLCIFRAGVWKPRTSPDSFQGMGEIALEWLQEVKRKYMPVATEVANAEHVRLCAQYGIEHLWIGARTSANPIAVQEIADAIRRYYTQNDNLLSSVWIKNPVNEDADLWQGNIERIQKTVADRLAQESLVVGAIHRGCGHRPCWHMPYLLRRSMPTLPILLDPSHLTGDAQQVTAYSQIAARLGLEGLMIEVHNNPKQALSDAKQQITPSQLSSLLKQYTSVFSNSSTTALDWLRLQIDETDDNIWRAIAHRLQIAKSIGKWKHENDVPVLQTDRFNSILRQRLSWAQDKGIESESVRIIMDVLHRESRRVQDNSTIVSPAPPRSGSPS